ncbi:MAG TPA: hypothetical protein VIN72_02200 [Lutibacter sp.]
MEIKELKKFIIDTRKILYNIPDYILEDYIKNDFEFPVFLNITYDYHYLQETHFKINTYLFEINPIILVDDKKECDEVVNQLICLKIFTDSLIKSHNKYTKGKFQKIYDNRFLEIKGEDNFIPIHNEINSKKSIFMKLVYRLIINENRIDNSDNQRKAFISLFFPTKQVEPIKWKYPIYDLKRFFDLLMENNLINQPKYFNELIINNFLILNKQNHFQKFTIKSFQTSKEKEGYNHNEEYFDWEKKIQEIKVKLR